VRTFVYGASGHGKVVLDILLASGAEVVGFIDDGRPPGTLVLGLPVAGGGDFLVAEARQGDVAIALGIGDNAARQRVFERCHAAGADIISAVHPRATVARSASIGRGTVIMAGAVVNPDAAVGIGAIVNTGAVVEHDCVLGDFAHLSPNAALGGGARIGDLSHVGLCAVVLPCKSVGERSIVGAGAVVVRDLPDDVIAAGVPARILKQRSP
jgi:sugar O-acyltransferase (sialic acid O-acetyltransferase NeuD family)